MQESVKEERNKYIGGSDIACIMGISPFKTRWQLLNEKAGIVEDTFKGNAYTAYGNVMEEKIRRYINSNLVYGETPYYEDKIVIEPKGKEPIGIRCHCDGINDSSILEVKTTSDIHADVDDYKVYLVQLLFYMLFFQKRYGMLAVYERPEDMSEEFNATRLHIYRIDMLDYEDLIENISEEVLKFKEDLRDLKSNPFLEEEDLMPQELVEITDKIVALEDTLASLKAVEKQVKDFKAQLKEEMQKHGVKKWNTASGYSICLIDDTPDTVEVVEELDIESLKRDLPELFNSRYEGGYMEQVEKVKKGRAGFVRISIPKRSED